MPNLGSTNRDISPPEWWQRFTPSHNISEFGQRHGGTRRAFWMFIGILGLSTVACAVVAAMTGRSLNGPDPLLNSISYPMLFLAFGTTASFFRWRYALTIMGVITVLTALGFVLN